MKMEMCQETLPLINDRMSIYWCKILCVVMSLYGNKELLYIHSVHCEPEQFNTVSPHFAFFM